MRKLTALLLSACVLMSAFGVNAFAGSYTVGSDVESDVTVNITADGDVPPFKVVDEPTWRAALEGSWSVIPVWNSFSYKDDGSVGANGQNHTGEPVAVPSGRTVTIVSATGSPITITQSLASKRHLDFTNAGDIDLAFDGNIVLDGNNLGGGVSMSGTTSVEFTQLELTNCVSSTNGAGAGIHGQSGAKLTLTESTLSGNSNTSGTGGVYINNGEAHIIDSTISNNTGDEGGGICVDNGTLVLESSTVSGNAASNGGGIAVKGTSAFTWNGGTVSSNSASVDGGGIAIGQDVTLTFTAQVTFSGNSAAKAYWIEKDDDTHAYNGKTASELKTLYDTTYKSYVTALSDSPSGCAAFGYMYNNFDVAYAGTDHSSVSPGDEKIIFDASTDAATLVYGGEVTDSDALLPLTSDKPTINIFNTANELWSLMVSYDIFTVDGTPDTSLKFALRDSLNAHNLINAETPHAAFTATDAWPVNFITEIPWGVGNDDLLKIHLPAYRNDLAGKVIKSTISWSLQIAP